jgi:hypothetical protein
MKNFILTIGLLAILVTGAACGSNTANVDLDDQQQAAAQEDAQKDASWGSYVGNGI